MLHQVTPVFDSGFTNYSTTEEGLSVFWDDVDFITHIRGFIKGSSAHPQVADIGNQFIDIGGGQNFPPVASGKYATGVATVKIGTAYVAGLVICEGYTTLQTGIAGTVAWAAIDVTYVGKAF